MGLNTAFLAVCGKRLLVALATLISSAVLYAGATEQTNLAHLPDKLSETERYQLLYRTTFGPTKSSYNQLQKLGYKEWLQRQFSLPASSHEKLFLTLMSLNRIKPEAMSGGRLRFTAKINSGREWPLP